MSIFDYASLSQELDIFMDVLGIPPRLLDDLRQVDGGVTENKKLLASFLNLLKVHGSGPLMGRSPNEILFLCKLTDMGFTFTMIESKNVQEIAKHANI